MTPRWKLWGLLLLVLALPACFQEAGESLQSAGNTAEPLTNDTPQQVVDTPTPSDADPTESGESNQADSGEPTRIPLTVISQPPDNFPELDTATPVSPDDQVSATQPQFITPVSPLVPTSDSTVETFIPAQATSSALITPTAFGNNGAEGGSEDGEGDTAASEIDPACLYSVQAGDNLYRIALDNSTTVEQMRNANPSLSGENPVLQIGQELQLPNCSGEDTLQVDEPPQPTEVPGSIDTATQPAAGGEETYVVRPGDTLFIIAQRLGTTVNALQQANQLADPNRLSVGQVLIIP